MARTNTELVEAVRRDMPEASAALVERYQDRVVRAAYHLVGDRDAAEDLAQDTFVAAYGQIRRLRDADRLGAWLHGILQRLCYKHLIRNERWSDVELEQLDLLAAPPDRLDEPGALCHMLNQLPAPHRQVLAARYLDDLEFEEIAALLGITVNNARVRCTRAKQKLRGLFEELDAVTTRADPRLFGGLVGPGVAQHRLCQAQPQGPAGAPHRLGGEIQVEPRAAPRGRAPLGLAEGWRTAGGCARR